VCVARSSQQTMARRSSIQSLSKTPFVAQIVAQNRANPAQRTQRLPTIARLTCSFCVGQRLKSHLRSKRSGVRISLGAPLNFGPSFAGPKSHTSTKSPVTESRMLSACRDESRRSVAVRRAPRRRAVQRELPSTISNGQKLVLIPRLPEIIFHLCGFWATGEAYPFFQMEGLEVEAETSLTFSWMLRGSVWTLKRGVGVRHRSESLRASPMHN